MTRIQPESKTNTGSGLSDGLRNKSSDGINAGPTKKKVGERPARNRKTSSASHSTAGPPLRKVPVSYGVAPYQQSSRVCAKETAASRARVAAIAKRSARHSSKTDEEADALREVTDFLRRRRAEVAAREALQPALPQPLSTSAGTGMDGGLNQLRVACAAEAIQPETPEGVKTLDAPVAARTTSLRSSIRESLEQSGATRSLSESMQSSVDTAKSSQRFVGVADDVLASEELENFTLEVAACIIQHYWREARGKWRSSEPSKEAAASIQAQEATILLHESPQQKQPTPKMAHDLGSPVKERREDVHTAPPGGPRPEAVKSAAQVCQDLTPVFDQGHGDPQAPAANSPSEGLNEINFNTKSDEEKELIAWATGLVAGAVAAPPASLMDEGSRLRQAVLDEIPGSPRSPQPSPIVQPHNDSEGELTPRARLPSPLPRSPGSASPAGALPARRVLSAGLPSGLSLGASKASPSPSARSEGSVQGKLQEPVYTASALSQGILERGSSPQAVQKLEEGFPVQTAVPVSAIKNNAGAAAVVQEPLPEPTPSAAGPSPSSCGADLGPKPLSLSLRPEEGLPARAVANANLGRREEVRQSAKKLAEIMSFLDEVEQGAGEERMIECLPPAAAWDPPTRSSQLERGAALNSQHQEDPSQLATSVFDGIKARMAEMQRQLEASNARAEELEARLTETQEQARAWVHEAESRAAAQMQRQQEESKSTISRHLEFIDRLLADKDSLSSKCTSLAAEVQSQEARHEASIAALKEGWAEELRRQKDAWAAAERIKRESWAEEKTREVKELTIKGLEPEIQRLMAKHKADMRKLEQRLGEEAQQKMDTAVRQQEEYVRQLRDRLLKEREDAVEKERLAAADRVRDVNERHEMQAQQQRQRLVGDADNRVEEVDRQRRTERQRLEAALEKAMEEAAQREAAARTMADQRVAEMQRAHAKALEQAREEWSAQQEGWRAAVAEKASQEVAQCEEQLRAEMKTERDKQIETIMDRLEEEATRSQQRAEEDHMARQEALLERHRGEMKEIQAALEKAEEKARALSRAQQHAEEQAVKACERAQEAEKALAAKASTVTWLEAQVNDAQNGWERRAAEIREASNLNEAGLRRQIASKEEELAQLRSEVFGVRELLEEAQQRKAEEMEQVDARVRAAISRKDNVIAQLKEENSLVASELQHTKDVLKRQKQAFCS